jgi:hypothetical protein
MAEQLEVGSPLWWISKLEAQLDKDQQGFIKLDNYYEGKHRLAFATAKYRDAFGDMFSTFADNWCDLVVDSSVERLSVEGFRFDNAETDDEAWRIWQANQLDAESEIGHTEALVHSRAYVIVWPDDNDPTTPLITIEHPREVVVASAAVNRRRRLAALKRFTDDDGYRQATLYLPEAVFKYRSERPIKGGGTTGKTKWVPLELDDETWPLENKMGIVPVVPLVNRRRLLNDGVSEIAKIISIQDAINKTVADMLVASEYGAAPQRWATGISVPKDPKTGLEMPEAFPNLISRLWTSTSANTKFGQFEQTDLSTFVNAVEMLVQHVASQTRTPPHYFYLNGQFPSGESIKSAETGLVAKVRRKQRHFGETWEEVIRLAFLATGDITRAASIRAETVWADPESRSESEHTDAVIKQKAVDIPTEALWEELGKSPMQIERYKKMQAAASADVGPTSPQEMSFEQRVETLAAYVRAGFDPGEAAAVLGLPPVKHTGKLPVTVQGDK